MASESDDKALFSALAAGGARAEGALKVLHDAYARRLLGLLKNKGFSLDEAEDIVQEAFLKIFRAGPRLAGVEAPKAYLYQTVINSSADYLRRRQKSAPEFGVDPEELAQASDKQGAGPDADYEGFTDCFEDAFRRFEESEPDRAMAIRLGVIEGMNGRELAEAIGRSYGAAREFLSQTRKKFQALLTDLCGDYLPSGAVE